MTREVALSSPSLLLSCVLAWATPLLRPPLPGGGRQTPGSAECCAHWDLVGGGLGADRGGWRSRSSLVMPSDRGPAG